MNEQRTALIDAYCRKGCAHCRLYYIEQTESGEGFVESPDGSSENPNLQAANNVWREVLKFTEATDLSVSYCKLFVFNGLRRKFKFF